MFRSVDEYLDASDRRGEVLAMRALVLAAAPDAVEIIKWNSPSYVVGGEDRLTINAGPKGPVRLILHRGVHVAEDKRALSSFAGDPTGLLTWHSDIRASMTSTSPEAVDVIRAWLAT